MCVYDRGSVLRWRNWSIGTRPDFGPRLSMMMLEAWLAFDFKRLFFVFKSTTSIPEHFSVWACLLALEHNWYCWCKGIDVRDSSAGYFSVTAALLIYCIPVYNSGIYCIILSSVQILNLFFSLLDCFSCFSIKQLDDSTQLRNLLFACLITFQPHYNKVIPSVWNDVVAVSKF